MNPSHSRIYQINALKSEFRGGQLMDASTLRIMHEIEELLSSADPVSGRWPKPDFHSVGPRAPRPALFSLHRTSTLAYHADSPPPAQLLERMEGISESLEATLEGEPIVVLHFLTVLEIADPVLSDTYGLGDMRMISRPVFPDGLRLEPWCFNVRSVWGAHFTQGTGPGSFIDFYLRNKMTGLEFVPQRLVSDDPRAGN